jgi:hypothetical protein
MVGARSTCANWRDFSVRNIDLPSRFPQDFDTHAIIFEENVAAAEERGVESYPLYHWTKATIENPAKKEKYLKSFTLYVDGQEVYAKEIADASEADFPAQVPIAAPGFLCVP